MEEVVEFVLNRQEFAIGLESIKEIIESPPITALPNSDPCIMGIIDLRGETTTIIDLKKKLNTKSEEIDNGNLYIIVLDPSNIGSRIGVIADDVIAITKYTDEEIDRLEGNDNSNIIGVIKKKIKENDKITSKLILLIDIKKTLES